MISNHDDSSLPGPRERKLFSGFLQFARQLKERGLKVTSARVIDAARSFSLIDLAIRQDFYSVLRANLVSSPEEITIFDELFEKFWSQIREELPELPAPGGAENEPGEDLIESLPQIIAIPETAPGDEEAKERGEEYSPYEMLMLRDFSRFAEAEPGVLEREFVQLLKKIIARISRRREPALRGREVDFRRSLRRSLSCGGELFELVRRRKRTKPVKIMVICDVSGSMDASTLYTLQFIFGLHRVFHRSEYFVFSTRLTRITDILKHQRWRRALAMIGERVQDWSGGTKIGYCLKLFNQRYGSSLPPGGAAIIIISDGWDRGDTALLDAEMKQLRRKARRLIWMNPLLGSPGYQPLAKGMSTALPHIDHFLPASNLKGLKVLGKVLADLSY